MGCFIADLLAARTSGGEGTVDKRGRYLHARRVISSCEGGHRATAGSAAIYPASSSVDRPRETLANRGGRLRLAPLRLAGQPFEILAILLETPGEVVTREALRARLWPENTFVDYEHSLNAAVNKLRDALSDSADRPLYIETLPRRGYWFIAPVERIALPSRSSPAVAPEPAAPPPDHVPLSSRAPEPLPPDAVRGPAWRRFLVPGLLVVATVSGAAAFLARGRDPRDSGRVIRAVAVLPFENLNRDPEQDYFADGVTEALISRLSQIRSLHVVSRTSVMQYRGAKQPLPEIARRLSVDAVVEGTVQRAGDRVAIFATLVDAGSDKNLWSGRYEGEVRDVLGLQSQVAGAIAEGVRAEVSPDERTRVEWARTVEPEAYRAYLKGRYYSEKAVPWATARAVKEFQTSVEKDPTFAPAWVRLGEAELFHYPPTKMMPLARAAALKGLELNPRLAEGHVILGLAQTFWDWDWAGAEKSFQRGIQLDPNSSDAHYRYAHLLVALRRFEPAIAECQRALELDPLSPKISEYLGRVLYFARRYPEAAAQLEKTLDLDSNSYWANMFLSDVYARLDRPEDSERSLERMLALSGTPTAKIARVQQQFRAGGRRAAVRELVPRPSSTCLCRSPPRARRSCAPRSGTPRRR